MIERLAGKLESLLFDHRRVVLAIFALITIGLGYEVTGLHIDAGFEKLLPLDHVYIQTFLEHREEFGGADRLLIAVRAKDGDIFTPEFFDTLDKVTDAVFFLPGVNRSTVTSLFTPNVRFIEIVEGGFTGGNVVPADFAPTSDMLVRVRENILKSGTVGRLVANDFSAAMVTAQLVEFDPATGEKLDYLEVADLLESQIRDVYVSEAIDVHIIGFAKIMGDIADGAAGVILFFGVAFLITAILVYAFIHSARLMVLPLICATLSVAWTLGLLTLFGYGLDPMSLLVPFLIFAIGVSHGVQMINAVGAEVFDGADSLQAARLSFRRLLAPGAAALISDTVGFLTLLLIDIRIIQELAITASLGVIVIIFTNLVLLPVLLSYPRFDEKYRDKLHRSARHRERLWAALARFTRPRWAVTGLLVAAGLGAMALVYARDIEIGDIHAGVPELRPDSRYNRDSAMISERFSIGLDILTAIVETIPDGCVEHDIMTTVDEFQWQIQNVEGVQSAISLPHVAKIVNAGWNEGNPKWRVLPRNPATLSQAVTPVETSTGLLNSDCSVLPVIFFLEDHRAQTIERVVTAVKAYASGHDSDRHRFRLATGNVGVMAATNEVVKAAQVDMLLYIYLAVILLSLLTFRSWRGTLCIVLPLSLVSVLSYALMTLLGIGLKISTLPVAALGVGIGVDYGIYIYSRLQTYLQEGMSLGDAYWHTLKVTGNAVLVTALTLAIGVSTWIFSALQFQSDMGILLTFIFLANMLGAMLLLPSLAYFLVRPKRVRA